MAENSKIEWTDHTGGPWLGCSEVSPGCLHCYARELMLSRLASLVRAAYRAAGVSDWKMRAVWGKNAPRVMTKGFWEEARRLDRKAGKEGRRDRMFPSMIDWLDDMPAGIIDQDGKWLEPIAVLADFLKLIHETPNLDWLLLTKRPGDWRKRVDSVALLDNADMSKYKAMFSTRQMARKWVEDETFPENVWIGASVEDQARADERIPEVLRIPARVRFLSVEPMLGRIDFERGFSVGDTNGEPSGPRCKADGSPAIDWVIFGGESGAGARGCNVDWIRDGVRQCREAGVAAFVKQLGAVPFVEYEVGSGKGGSAVRLSVKDKKGGDMGEWPEDLRVREFPGRV